MQNLAKKATKCGVFACGWVQCFNLYVAHDVLTKHAAVIDRCRSTSACPLIGAGLTSACPPHATFNTPACCWCCTQVLPHDAASVPDESTTQGASAAQGGLDPTLVLQTKSMCTRVLSWCPIPGPQIARMVCDKHAHATVEQSNNLCMRTWATWEASGISGKHLMF